MGKSFKNVGSRLILTLAAALTLVLMTAFPTKAASKPSPITELKQIDDSSTSVEVSWSCLGAVSYTHLDVYKRQVMQPHEVRFVWVKGHDGHPQNERCDTLATTAADGSGLLDDMELESGKNEQLGLGDILK